MSRKRRAAHAAQKKKADETVTADTTDTSVPSVAHTPKITVQKRENPDRLPLFLNTFFVFLLIFLLGGGILLQTALTPITLEAGEPLPAADAFVRYPFLPYACLTDLSDPTLTEPGTHTVRFFLWGRHKETTLTVADTTAPVFTLQPLSVLRGAAVTPTDFVDTVTDYSAVTFTVHETFPETPGEHTVTVTATDAAGNTATAQTTLTVFALEQNISVEAGTSLAAFTQQIKSHMRTASPASDFDETLLQKPGEHTVHVTIRGNRYPLTLTVTDTVPPAADVKEVYILKGTALSAEQFIKEVRDETAVTASFAEDTPDVTAVGTREVAILLTDEAGNTAIYGVTLHVLPIPASITAEAGTPFFAVLDTLSASNADAFVVDTPSENILQIGKYVLTVHTEYGDFFMTLTVVDTIPPTAIARTVYVYENETDTPTPADFVTGITDATAVTAAFEKTPDFKRIGLQDVKIRLTDAAGNTTTVTAILSVLQDTEAPIIHGIRDLSVYVGGTLSYRAGISATDGDTSVAVQVDASRVNLKNPGTYTVYYTATDVSGNTSTLSATVTVLEIPYSLISSYAQEILDGILKPGMTNRQKARAIYDWMKENISYIAYADKTYWMRAAYHGFTTGKGDCYVYYAMSRILLDCAGIENMEIKRNIPDKPHYWNLINCGDGWYHFDTCPHYKNYPLESFMLTDAQVKHYSDYYVEDYYSFDRDLYPATP